MMRKMVILFFLCLLNLSCVSYAKDDVLNKNELTIIKSDIKNSFTALQDVTRDPSSIQLKKIYLDRLTLAIDDIHSIYPKLHSHKSKQKLDQLALALMFYFNGQQNVGLDSNGSFGTHLFTDVNNNEIIYDRVIPNPHNKGSGDISVNIKQVDQPPMSDYKLHFHTSTYYTLTRQSDDAMIAGKVITFPHHIHVDGMVININQSDIAANDRFIISPLRNAAHHIQLSINDPALLAMAWPIETTIDPQQAGSSGSIAVTAITDKNNDAFSIPQQLKPPISIIFTSSSTYKLINTITEATIEPSIIYSPTLGANIFPTSNGFDPGYRVMINGVVKEGDEFSIHYNLHTTSDNRNSIAIEELYQTQIFKLI